MSYKLSLRAPRKTAPTKKYDWASLPQHADEFQRTFTEKLSRIPIEHVQYEAFVEAVNDAASEVLGPPPKRRSDPWVSEGTLLLRAERDKAKAIRGDGTSLREKWKKTGPGNSGVIRERSDYMA